MQLIRRLRRHLPFQGKVKFKTVQPQLCCEGTSSHSRSPTGHFSFGARLTPLNQAPLVGKPYYLASLDEMQLIRPTFFRNCTPFALRALPSVGGSSAMRNEKNQIYFVLNLYRHLPRLGRRVKPCCARKGSPGNGISIFPSLCIYILFIII